MKKKYFLAVLLIFTISIDAWSDSRPSVRRQLLAIDALKNDSAAIVKLEELVKTGDLTPEESLRANARIIMRANSLQQFAKSVKLANDGILAARKNGLDSLEGAFNAIAGATNYFMELKKEAIEYFKEAIRIAQKNNFWEMEANCSHNAAGAMVDLADFKNAETFLLNGLHIRESHRSEQSHGYLLSMRVLATLY